MTEYVLVDENGDVVESNFNSSARAALRKEILLSDPLQPDTLSIEERPEQTFGIFVSGQKTAEETFEDEIQAERRADYLNQVHTGLFTMIETDPENPEVRPTDSTETETTEADDTQTSMNYNFVQNGDDAQTQTNDDSDTRFDWGYGDHSTASEEETSALSDAIESAMAGLDDDVDEEMMDVLDDARNLVASAELSDFECSHPDCGLSHGHGPRKHDITNDPDCSGISGFNVTQRFADQMEFVQNCHCGANEAAMLVQFFPYINIPMFQDEDQFSGVQEIEAEELRSCIQAVVADDDPESPQEAALSVVESRLPGVRDDLVMFLGRVQQMVEQANAAPIGQETQAVIDENREEIEDAVSE